MFPDSPFATPTGSFHNSVPLPGGRWNDPPIVTVCLSQWWLPYIIGCLKQLLLETTWDAGSPEALAEIQQQAFNLIELFANPSVNPLCIPSTVDWYVRAAVGTIKYFTSFDCPSYSVLGGTPQFTLSNTTIAIAYNEPLTVYSVDRATGTLPVGGAWDTVYITDDNEDSVNITVDFCDGTSTTFNQTLPYLTGTGSFGSSGWKQLTVIPVFGESVQVFVANSGPRLCEPA